MKGSRRRSGSSRSTGRSPPERRPRPGVDVYLFPAVVGGGRGDVEEVLNLGRHLHRAGFRLELLRLPGRPLPRGVNPSFDWPPVRRSIRPRVHHRRALTVSTMWGVTAASERGGPLGGAGPWAEEQEAIERAYGPAHTLHLSLEEFARTLGARAQVVERYREAGRPVRWIRRHLAQPSTAAEVASARRLYRRFRAFDLPNVVHLFPAFAPHEGFRREFPEAIVCAPIPPARPPPRQRSPRPSWLWYASPGSSERLLPALAGALQALSVPHRLAVRSPRSAGLTRDAYPGVDLLPPMEPRRWERLRADAEIEIVTGSRSLVESVAAQRPFLYFNGLIGSGRGARRHRPEKVNDLLAGWRRAAVPASYVRDLANFARGRDVPAIVRRAGEEAEWRKGFPRLPLGAGHPAPYDRPVPWIVGFLRQFGRGSASAAELVAALRFGRDRSTRAASSNA